MAAKTTPLPALSSFANAQLRPHEGTPEQRVAASELWSGNKNVLFFLIRRPGCVSRSLFCWVLLVVTARATSGLGGERRPPPAVRRPPAKHHTHTQHTHEHTHTHTRNTHCTPNNNKKRSCAATRRRSCAPRVPSSPPPTSSSSAWWLSGSTARSPRLCPPTGARRSTTTPTRLCTRRSAAARCMMRIRGSHTNQQEALQFDSWRPSKNTRAIFFGNVVAIHGGPARTLRLCALCAACLLAIFHQNEPCRMGSAGRGGRRIWPWRVPAGLSASARARKHRRTPPRSNLARWRVTPGGHRDAKTTAQTASHLKTTRCNLVAVCCRVACTPKLAEWRVQAAAR